jgi:hypothetical protein
MEYHTTASITVQTAATYTVTTTNASGCTSLQGSGVAAPKTTPTAPVVNVVNNCDGTSTLTNQLQEFYYGALVNQLLQ